MKLYNLSLSVVSCCLVFRFACRIQITARKGMKKFNWWLVEYLIDGDGVASWKIFRARWKILFSHGGGYVRWDWTHARWDWNEHWNKHPSWAVPHLSQMGPDRGGGPDGGREAEVGAQGARLGQGVGARLIGGEQGEGGRWVWRR